MSTGASRWLEDSRYAAVQRGFESLQLSPDKTEPALASLGLWLHEDRFSEYHDALNALIEREAWDLLLYNFFRTMPFGTGGRRGPVGIGPNCFNAFTLATSVQGHVEYLRKHHGADAELSVVIAFDVRIFEDSRGRYEGIPNPLTGTRSRDFARIAAEVYAANGVIAHIPDPEGDWILSTPELSFAIRQLGAVGGLNVSASHNHPDDSGGKFYEHLGGQETPPRDEEFSNLVEAIHEADRIPFDEARASGRVIYLDRSIHHAYVQMNSELALAPDARSARVVFTNLHGAGDTNVGELLEATGFEVLYEPTQRPHDGRFPEVPFRIANPEVPESMGRAAALAQREGADLVLSTDPDADRIGLMVPGRSEGDEFIFVDGNQIGALVTDYRFERLKSANQLPANPLFVTTEVTSRLVTAVAKSYGADTVDDLLVGCKYIAGVLAALESDGEYRGRKGTMDDYVIGLEESHGVMITPNVRDKDGAGAALALAECASLEKDHGRTLFDRLVDLWRRVGIHVTRQVAIVIEGAIGMEKIARIQEGFRNLQVGDELGGIPIASRQDFWDEAARGPFLSGTDRTARNFMSFRLEGGIRVLCRPSGTEPKIKIYTEHIGDPLDASSSTEEVLESRAALETEAVALTDRVAQFAYRQLGIEMPRFGLRVSPLLPLTARKDFVENFVSELAREAATASNADALRTWADARLDQYGKDPRALVRHAVSDWMEGEEALSGADAIRTVFDLS